MGIGVRLDIQTFSMLFPNLILHYSSLYVEVEPDTAVYSKKIGTPALPCKVTKSKSEAKSLSCLRDMYGVFCKCLNVKPDTSISDTSISPAFLVFLPRHTSVSIIS